MNDKWSLDALYKGYDEAFKSDVEKLKQYVKACKELAENLSHADEKKTLHQILQLLEKLHTLHYRLAAYTNLRQSVDTTDSETASWSSRITVIMSHSSKACAAFNRYIAEIGQLEEMIEQDHELQPYAYLLKTTKRDGKYLLGNEVEEALSKLDISAGSAWEMMHSYLTSTLEVEYRGETTTLSAIRNMAYDSEQKTRKDAYEAELAAYQKIRDAIAFSLNSIKQQVISECLSLIHI